MQDFWVNFIILSVSCLLIRSDESSNYHIENISFQVSIFRNGESNNGVNVVLDESKCSPITTIHDFICPLFEMNNNCVIYNSIAQIVSTCDDTKNDDSLFVVPYGKLFVHPTYEIGHRTTFYHIRTLNPELASDDENLQESPSISPVVLETIQHQPRIFKIHNFFTSNEADSLIQHALRIEEEDFRLKRSSTGTNGYHVDDTRTSENAFDTGTKESNDIKKRAFELLGIYPYNELLADGLQILRYNISTAYNSHMDYIENDDNADHNWDSKGNGTNRFATILLYLSDVEDGGETVFPLVELPNTTEIEVETKLENLEVESGVEKVEVEVEVNNETIFDKSKQKTINYVTAKNLTDIIPIESWQMDMVHSCRNTFAVRPAKLEAILFYSQHPDGAVDRLSLHGGCPVLEGTKWAANLWVWNGVRFGYWSRDPATGELVAQHLAPVEVQVTFAVSPEVEAAGEKIELFWVHTGTKEEHSWGYLTTQPLGSNSYSEHIWIAKRDNKIIQTWTLGRIPIQTYVIESYHLL